MLKFYTKRFQKVTHIQFIFDKNFAFLSLIEMKMSNWIFFHLKIQHLNVTIEIFDGVYKLKNHFVSLLIWDAGIAKIARSLVDFR